MATERGITCPRCGASTPLPGDLRVPTFACAYCRAELQTAAFAGAAAVSADALLGHVNAAMQGQLPVKQVVASAPRFAGGSTESRPAECHHCRAAIAVPLDLQVKELTCSGCGRTQAVNEYISNNERFALDMQRQMAGNEAFKRLRAEGVACSKCGGKNGVPDDGSVQIVCQFCRAPILLSDHVDASAVARARLKHGVYAMRDEAIQRQKAQQRTITLVIVIGIAVVFVLIIIGSVVAKLLG